MRGRRRAVAQALGARARDGDSRAASLGDRDDAMHAGFGDRDAALLEPQAVPGRAQPVREDGPLSARERVREQLAGDGVADQQTFTIETHALRLVEPVERHQHSPVELADQHAVVARVGDRDARPAVGGHLAGKRQRRSGAAPHRGERGAGREIRPTLEQPLDHTAKRLPVALAGRRRDYVAVGIDHHQRRPGTDAVLLPCLEIGVVEDGMHDPVAGNGSLDGGVVRLVGELR